MNDILMTYSVFFNVANCISTATDYHSCFVRGPLEIHSATLYVENGEAGGFPSLWRDKLPLLKLQFLSPTCVVSYMVMRGVAW